jgi:hypothetical protein
MAVSFTWAVVKPGQANIFASGELLNDALENVFGSLPVTLRKKDIEAAQIMTYCGFSDMQAVVTALKQHGVIKIEANR